MAYLIMIGSSFAFLLSCLVFCFIPIFKITKYPISYLVGNSAVYKYSILDILDQPKALVSFILVILSVILVFIMLVKAFKLFESVKFNRSMGDYVFSIVTTLCVLTLTIFIFLLFTSHSEVDMDDYLYSYHKRNLATFILFVIFSAVSFILNLIAVIIKSLNMFVPTMANKKFFKMACGKEKEIKEERNILKQNDKLSIDKIEMLEKLYNLKEKGIISEEEFNERKSKLL